MQATIEDLLTQDQIIDDLMALALKQDEIGGIIDVLQFITTCFDALGSILWAQPVDEEEKNLFALAQFLSSSFPCPLHNIGPDESLAGKVIQTEKPDAVLDAHAPDYKYSVSCKLLQKRIGFGSYISVPVHLSKRYKGALNIYFKGTMVEQPVQEIHLAMRIGRLMPGIYQGIRERAGFHLLKDINKIFYDAGVASIERTLLKHQEMNAIIQRVSERIGKTFRAKETSILLKDEFDAVKGFEIRGTTSPDWVAETGNNIYHGNLDEGLVGWCLNYKLPVKIFDLLRFNEDSKSIKKDYPRIVWSDPANIKRKAKKLFGNNPENFPPISFISAPIVIKSDRQLVGAIRCAMAKTGPFYYSNDDLDLLQLVAEQICQAWRGWINRRTVIGENDFWELVVESMGALNLFVRRSLNEGKLAEKELFDQIFEAIKRILPDVTIMSAMFYDEKKNCLYHKHLYGDLWKFRPDGTERSKDELRVLNQNQFFNRPDNTYEKISYFTGKVFAIDNVHNEFGQRLYNKLFPSVERIIVAPIPYDLDNKNLGILTIQSETRGKLPRNSGNIFSLIGHQIGLYYRLYRIFEEKKRTYENLAHQLITPIDQAYKRTAQALEIANRRGNVTSHILKIKGLCNKAKAVTSSIRLFVDFEQGTTPSIKLQEISSFDYIKKLVECSADNQLMVDPYQNLHFNVKKETFDCLKQETVKLNEDLYVQALNNVLENAGKYSYQNTEICISGGLMNDENYFFTSIKNKGFVIDQSTVAKCIERGWRGPHVHKISSSGSGIGLWIADLIMKAHNGRLEIIPTGADGWTEVRLVLPLNLK